MFRRNFLVVGNVSPKFLVNSVGDSRLAPVYGRNWKNHLNRGNLSAKGCLPERKVAYLSEKLPT
jgi:hypothetical protein